MKQTLIDGIQYELDRKTCTASVVSLTDGDKYAGNIVIPSFITQKRFLGDDKVYNVTHIHSSAFANSDITFIVIPHTVKSIDDRSFEGCSSLKTISIPKDLSYIGSYAFNGCSKLTSIQLPNSITTISTGVFRNCKSLATIVIPDSATRLEENAFENCSCLTSINIPQHVDFIGTNCFQGCTSITTIIWDAIEYNGIKEEFIRIPRKVDVRVDKIMQDVLHNPFYRSDSYTTQRELISPFNSITKQIESFVFGDNVHKIPNFICEEMRNLMHVSFGINVESVGKDAFKACSSIESISWNVKNSEGSIDKKLFDYCLRHMNWGIKSITFGEQITDIPDRLCENIRNLNSVKFGSNIKSVGENAFAGTKWLKNHTDNIYINRYLYKAILPNNVSTYTISKETLGILSGAFSICTSLKSIIIPNTITSIGKKAFLDCKSLETISIPNSVTSIGEEAFAGCSSLTSIVIPNSVTNIGEYAFAYCSSLTSIMVEKGNVIYDSRNKCNAIIETATNTLIFGCQNTIIPNDITSIGTGAFRGSTSLTSIILPNSIIRIENEALFGCSKLESITIPNSVKSIGERAFCQCRSLTSCFIANSVTNIGKGAFSSCISLASITIPSSVTNVGERTFSLCSFAKGNFINNSSCISEDNFRARIYDEEINGFFINNHEIQACRTYLHKATCIEIPYSITSIKEDFFRKEDFPYLTSIVWDAVSCKETKWEERVGSYSWDKKTFYGPFAKIASQITSFEFGSNVKHIPKWLCADMNKLKKITIPSNVLTIEKGAFGMSIKEITIPAHIHKKYYSYMDRSYYNDLAAIFQYAKKINIIAQNLNQLLN